MKVLLVEDDTNMRRLLIRLLRRMFDDVHVCVAESVDEAIDYLREAVLDRPFSLIISDWDLLGSRKGGEVLEWIREHASQLEPRFMFLSGNEAIQNQSVRFIEKPCDTAALKAAIEATLYQS